jgi:hypothetical protein
MDKPAANPPAEKPSTVVAAAQADYIDDYAYFRDLERQFSLQAERSAAQSQARK